jgi:endonuclease/exonuclease/phosphatase family metal-dependent hydrolase
MRVRVVTLNVWNEEGDQRRFAFINRELRRLSPDLLALQEVADRGSPRRLEQLLEGTGLAGTHQSDVLRVRPPGSERYGGNAIATRWPHRVVEGLDQRLADASDVPWATLAAVVSIPDKGDLLFICTTTSWRLDAETARERQVQALTDLDSRHRQALPSVIAGDFNAAPEASSIRYLTGLQSICGRSACYHDAWAIAGQGSGHTWTDENPNAAAVMEQIIRQPRHRRRMDYVFVGSWHAHPQARAQVIGAELCFTTPEGGIWASDHFGVVVDLDIDSSQRA